MTPAASFISVARRAAMSILIGAVVVPAAAEDLGVRGQTFELDRDAREEFKDVVRQKQASGELDRFWQSYRDKTVEAIKHPAPLGVKSSYENRIEFKPVRYVIASDYRDQNGRVVVTRGTVVEPLKLQPLATGLVFIDGRDPRQVSYAIARGKSAPMKIVLTAGSPYELRVKYQHEAWFRGEGIPFYFDQRRILLNTFKQLYGIDIASVPAVLTQSGTGVKLEFGLEGAR